MTADCYMADSHEIRKVYSEYLQSQDWDYFLTVTFRKEWRDTIKAPEAIWHTLYHDCHVQKAFLAVERHRYPSWACHIHGLVSGSDGGWLPEMVLPWTMWDKMFHHFGRSQVSAVNNCLEVSNYCSKYVTKQMSNYEFYGRKEFWR